MDDSYWFGGAKPLNMQNKKWVRFVESFVVLPILTMSQVPVGTISQAALNIAGNITSAPSIVSFQKQNILTYGQLAFNPAPDPRVAELQAKADAIDAYFGARLRL
jgi:hypothetical protein